MLPPGNLGSFAGRAAWQVLADSPGRPEVERQYIQASLIVVRCCCLQLLTSWGTLMLCSIAQSIATERAPSGTGRATCS